MRGVFRRPRARCERAVDQGDAEVQPDRHGSGRQHRGRRAVGASATTIGRPKCRSSRASRTSDRSPSRPTSSWRRGARSGRRTNADFNARGVAVGQPAAGAVERRSSGCEANKDESDENFAAQDSVEFTLELTTAATIRIEHKTKDGDVLAADDAAYVSVPPPKALSGAARHRRQSVHGEAAQQPEPAAIRR